jgi:hypothetical protein
MDFSAFIFCCALSASYLGVGIDTALPAPRSAIQRVSPAGSTSGGCLEPLYEHIDAHKRSMLQVKFRRGGSGGQLVDSADASSDSNRGRAADDYVGMGMMERIPIP